MTLPMLSAKVGMIMPTIALPTTPNRIQCHSGRL